MRRTLLPVAVGLTLALGAASNAGAAAPEHWVGSWAASPSDASHTQPLSHQTLRMIIAPHLGGRTVRIHFSNRFGTSTVTIGPVTLGVQAAGPALRPGTLRAVKFHARTKIRIPVGGEVVSDPVPLAFRAFRKLAVSVYIPGSVPEPTEHLVTQQTSYMTPTGGGDTVSDVAGAAFTQRTTQVLPVGWYFLDGLDVQAPSSTAAVVAFGDSITDGGTAANAIDTNSRYPDALQRRLSQSTVPISVLNAGISGNRLLRLGGELDSAERRFRADALDLAGVRDVIALEGINDLGDFYVRSTVAQMIAAYKRLIAEAHAAGIRIQLGTLTPARGASEVGYYGTIGTNVQRDAVNRWIRTQKLSDGVIDFDAGVRDRSHQARIAAAYDESDHLHFSAAGYSAMARAVPLRVLEASLPEPKLRIQVMLRRSTGATTVATVAVTSTSWRGTRPASLARVTVAGQVAYTNSAGRLALRLLIARGRSFTVRASSRAAASAALRVQLS